jgi:flagellar secretion chaperone FliS
MSYGIHAAQYRDTEVMTASPAQLVVVLYDHMLVCLRRARYAIDANNAEQRLELIHRARMVVGELLATLDRERGGEIASNLASLYAHTMTELMDIGRHPDTTRLEAVTHMMTELRDAFATVAGERQEVSA